MHLHNHTLSLVTKFIIVCCLSMVFLANTVIAAPNQKPVTPKQTIKAHKKGKLIIKFRQGANSINTNKFMQGLGVSSIRTFKVPPRSKNAAISNWRVITVPTSMDLRKLRERLLKNKDIEAVEYDYEIKINALPNDPSFGSLWGLRNTGQTGGTPGADIQAEAAWDINTGSGVSSPLVAVIDTGIDYTHPDLIDNIWTNPGEIPGNGIDDDGNGYVDDIHGYDFVNNDGDPFDDNQHGTHVAGTIAAVGNNGIGVVGVNWNAKVMAAKFLDASGSGSTTGAIDAVLYTTAVGAKITNNSWGGGGFSQALEDAISAANAAGSLFVAAAGNNGFDTDINANYPSNYNVENIISVAAIDRNDQLATFSNFGATTVDIAAPGVDILSTTPGNTYSSFNGTSMATPHVAGVAALLLDFLPGLTVSELKSRILGGVIPLPILNGKVATGGRLNALNALENDNIPPSPIVDLAIQSVTARNVSLNWSSSGDDALAGVASAYDVRYSTTPITETNFTAATSAGTAAGTSGLINFTVTSLEPSTSYFFAVKAIDNVGNTSLISNPVQATTKTLQIIYADNFESGLTNWLIQGSDGVGGPALWHLGTHRNTSPTNALYYGKDDTLTFNTGATNFGSATSPTFDLTGQTGTTLSFKYFLQTEGGSTFDKANVNVSTDGGASWTTVSTLVTNGIMTPIDIDLSSFDNQIIQIQFDFNTVDNIANDFEGWVIDDVELSVTASGAPTSVITSDDFLYINSPGIFDASLSIDPNGDPLTYEWNFGDGTPPVQGINVTHTYIFGGSFPVTLSVSDGNNPPTITAKIVTILNEGAPTAVITSTDSTFTQTPEIFDASLSIDPNGDPLIYQWDFNDGSPLQQGINITHTFQTSGTYNVILTVFDGVNATPATKVVTVLSGAPTAVITSTDSTFIQTPEVFDASLSTDPNGDLLIYDWDFGDGSPVQSGVNVTHTFLTSGTYTVTLYVVDGVNPPSIATKVVTVATGAPFAVINTSGPVYIQTPTIFDASLSSDPNGDPLIYDWDFGDGSPVQSGVNVSHVFQTTGTYTVTLYVLDGVNPPATANVVVTVLSGAPTAVITSTNSTLTQMPEIFDASLSTDPNGDPLIYDWDFGDGSPVQSGVNVTHTFLTSGTYTVTLYVVDGVNPPAIATKVVTVLPDSDGDGVTDSNDACPTGETGWTSNETTDIDADGCRDVTEDLDDDNDGVPDLIDPYPTDMVPTTPTDNFESADLLKLNWLTTGDAAWSASNIKSQEGSYAAEAPTSIIDNQSASISVTLDADAGNISFWYSVSSEPNFDFLRFYIDGVLQAGASWSGTIDWTQATFPVSAGSHTFTWIYNKDVSISTGSDTAWIDAIEFPITIPQDTDGDGASDPLDAFPGNPTEWFDSDNDGLGDNFEIANGLNPLDDGSIDPINGANGDADGDGFTNLEEQAAGSDASAATGATSNPGIFNFDTATISVNEDAGTGSIAVTRTGGSVGDVTVLCFSTDIDATADVDYTTVNTTLEWLDGDATDKTCSFTITPDSDIEGDETFQLDLSNPSGGAKLGEAAPL